MATESTDVVDRACAALRVTRKGLARWQGAERAQEDTMRIADIQVPKHRRRALDPASVRQLMDSIREVGLLNPITVTKDRMLVSGLHRKQACEQLGWTDIPVVVVDLDGLKAELAEIDENLVRNELSTLEHSDHLARRKEIYEKLHPEAVHGGDRRSETARSKRQVDDLVAPSFAEDTAAKTGLSKRTIEREVAISRDLAPDVKDALRGTEIADNQRALLALADEPAARQRELVAAGPKAIKEAAKAKRTKSRSKHVARSAPAASATEGPSALPERVRVYIERTTTASKLEDPRHVRALLRLAIECLNAKEKESRKLSSEYEEQFIKYTV
jgi:ParB family chromosome partitioning protein